MKKLISAVLATAMLLSSVPMIAHAGATTTVYEVTNTENSKVISKVAPLTKVSTFKANFTDETAETANVDVLNVDGTSMADNAYVTENVFAKVDGVLYNIDVEYPYDPLYDYGKYKQDGTVIFEKESANFNSTVDNQPAATNSGFAYGQSGYKLGDVAGAVPAINAGAKTVVTKQTENGQPVYIFENNAPRYGFLRSHYSSASYESQTQSALTDATKGKVSVTTVTFKTDKLGNVSLHHNAAGYATSYKGDASLERFTYGGYATYLANAVHFTQDGTIKIGGTYTNGASATDRTPAHSTNATWEPNEEYTVSVVQKLNDGGSRYAYVYGVYVNGEKIFPKAGAATPGSQFAYTSSKDAYSMTTRGDTYKYFGGISSILIGAAPQNAGDAMKTTFSDVKVYTLASASEFTGKIDADLVLENAADVEVDNAASVINATTDETVASLRAKYEDYAIAVYNSDGTQPEASANLATGMSAKVVSDDGLLCKVFNITAKTVLNQTTPESEIYTVDTEAKTISKVKPFTKVSDFLASFKNGSIMEVVNIDGSSMDASAYATENVSLKAPNGDLYAINVTYGYTPLATNGAELADGTSLYDLPASEADGNELTGVGFGFLQSYAKIGFGSDNVAPENTNEQTVKATKQTKNGKTVYVMENDSNNYAYIRSHKTESTNYSTSLNSLRDTWSTTPIVTTFEFNADKFGNISLFQNTPARNADKAIAKGDTGVDSLVYGSELPYAANSVHFLEDGSVKLGGMYSNYSVAYRTPIQETNFTWVPGKTYKVSVVQRYLRGKRESYIDGVYVNGEKIFPNDKTVNAPESRLSLQADGTFKIGTRSSSVTHGGDLSSIMIGTAPEKANENLTVSLSDVKVYPVTTFNPAMDAPITLTSNDDTIIIDNDAATISCIDGSVTVADFTTTAKLKVEGGYVKAVSADGLVAKTYAIVTEDIQKGFFNGENGPAIKSLAEAGDDVCFNVNVDETSLLDGVTPVVILGVFNKLGHFLGDCTFATGTKYSEEVTNYKAVLDISDYNKSEIEIRGFVWNSFDDILPLTDVSTLK